MNESGKNSGEYYSEFDFIGTVLKKGAN